jgi:hypothetical protein
MDKAGQVGQPRRKEAKGKVVTFNLGEQCNTNDHLDQHATQLLDGILLGGYFAHCVIVSANPGMDDWQELNLPTKHEAVANAQPQPEKHTHLLDEGCDQLIQCE